jgi:hypothetical protein
MLILKTQTNLFGFFLFFFQVNLGNYGVDQTGRVELSVMPGISVRPLYLEEFWILKVEEGELITVLTLQHL